MTTGVTGTLIMHQRRRNDLPADISPVHTRSATLSNDNIYTPSHVASSDYQRSASYTYLPTAGKEQYVRHQDIMAIRSTFSAADIIAGHELNSDSISEPSSGWTTPEEHDVGLVSDREAQRDLVMGRRNDPKSSVEQFLELEVVANRPAKDKRDESTSTASRARQRSSVSTDASKKLQRRSWYSVATTPDSRSPSPAKQEAAVEDAVNSETVHQANTARRRSVLPRKESFMPIEEQDDVSAEPEELRDSRPSTSRRSSIFRGKGSLSSIFSKASDSESVTRPAMPTIPKSFSTDRLTTLTSGGATGVHRAAVPPRLGLTDRVEVQSTFSTSRKKDELWSVFRTLDADHSKFSSKSVAFKANVIRSGLMPFLKTYANHPSTYVLRPEDLDRRASILNKWWTALIEMLHGRNNQSISGTDRPTILDGIAGIMERPEWRLYPSAFSPLDRRVKGALSTKTRSTTSLSSGTSDFLQDSVHQNVRNIFVQNLRAQMAFVVDKMSLRHASASLVTFCGKASAYAFMFVPGMADVLVRLWDLQADMLRRVLTENGVDRFGSLAQLSDDILPLFPPCLHELRFTRLSEFCRKLRTPPPLPTGTTNIQWWGYWLERWTGHESDLFYVFVKYYHILVADFLHVGSTNEERMCVPGMLLVHAQILSNLDATIHRQLGKNAAQEALALTQTVDDVLTDPDAVASTLPVPPINATRQMAENRLIMLIRDFLSERAAAFPAARQLFAETFNGLLQAATKGICVYDPAACYTLLELLEEALVILVKYEHLSTGAGGNLIEPEFWHLMSRRLISSENTLIEIRLYSFLYTVWNTVVCDDGRKADLCLGLLLDPQIFASRFNHWSPMVRAYYMRLLCWRVGRFDGDASPGEHVILETLLERLQTTWSHYLWQREEALENGTHAPQTSPCNPAPNRRLRIIRTDTSVNTNTYHSFDVIVPPMPPPPAQAGANSKRFSTLSTISSVAELEIRTQVEASSSVSSSPTGIRGLLRSVVSGKSRTQSRSPGTVSPPVPGSIPIPPPRRRDGAPPLSRSATDDFIPSRDSSLKSGTPSPASSAPGGNQRPFSFKFSFEYNINIKQPGPLRLIPPRVAAPAQKYLAATSDRVNSPAMLAVVEPRGIARKRVSYNGRALAEWALIVGECQSFFDRRRNEGVRDNKSVETPSLSVEIFKRPG